MASIVAPFGASLQTASAPAKVAPAVMPTKMPSFWASCLLQCIASAPAMVMMRSISFMSTASPVSFGMKSGLQPCIGCGLNAGCGAAGEPSGLRSCSVPLRQHRRVRRLADDDLGVRPFLAEHARDALERAAGAEAGHPVVEPLAGEIVDDLARRGARMHVGIGLVLELARQEPAVRRRRARSALLTMPMPRSAAGVSTTLAPRKRISLRRSTLKVSAIVTTSG